MEVYINPVNIDVHTFVLTKIDAVPHVVRVTVTEILTPLFTLLSIVIISQ